MSRFDIVVQISPGADLTANPSTYVWTDITDKVHFDSGITITRGRGDEHSTAPPSQISLTLNNTDGRFCPYNPEGVYYGTLSRNTPIRVRVHNGTSYVNQAFGYVDQWPATWGDKSETTGFAPITASGVLRRLGQGGTLRSALYRYHAISPYVDDSVVLGYWPCEDAAGSTSIASGIGGRAMVVSGGLENFAADSTILGSDPLMTLEPGVSLRGYLPAYTSTGETTIRAITKIPSAPAGNVELLRWWTLGSYTVWTVEIVPGSPDRMYLRAYNSSGVEQLGGGGINLEDDGTGTSMYNRQLYIVVDLVENAGAIEWSIVIWGRFAFNSGSSLGVDNGTEAAATVSTLVAIGDHTHSANADGITLGHIVVANDILYNLGGSAATGFAGESVSIRAASLAAELDLPLLVSGSDSPSMRTYVGASDAADVVDLLREQETAEQGILYDGKIGFLEFLLREDRYNRTVDLTLDHDAGQVDYLAPTDDDQQLRNDVTVSRPHGSEARAFDAAHIAANGNYSQTVDALLFQDTDLPFHAQWRVHLGTVDELRYPQVGINLTRNTSLLASWLACDIGSRIQITNPPPGLPPDTIDLHIEGYTEYLTPYEYRVELNCSPASPWQGLELDATGNLGRLDTDGSELLCAYDTDDTSLLLANTGSPGGNAAVTLWSTTAEPYDVNIAGERVTVTSMAAPSPSFVGAGSWSHGDNAGITPDIHASTVKGDIVLVLAAIRNTAATVGTPADADVVLFADENVALFGVVYGDTAPDVAVTFTGGSAGDTTSACTATFRGFQLTALGLTSLSNASAQNIALSAFLPPKANCLGLWVGWKQDDWTSAGDLFAGITEINEGSTTTGNDQALVWNYDIQTSPVEYGTGSWTITGGAAAVSKSYVLALPGDVQTATVTRSVNGVVKSHTAGTDVRLWKPAVLAL